MRTVFERQLSETLHALTPEPAEYYRDNVATTTVTLHEDPADGPHLIVALEPDRQRRPRWRRAVPIAASVAILAATGSIVALIATRDSGSGGSANYEAPAGPHGPTYHPPNKLSDTAIGAGQYSYRVMDAFTLDANGKRKKLGPDAMIDRSWISPNGDIRSFRSGGQTECYLFKHNSSMSFESPTRAFFSAMPTNVGALTKYFRSHVQGSSSHDEAVFVAVGDALREANALASPKLRAAMVAMLSRTSGVRIHTGKRDYLDRPALRADFVDQRIRPGEIHSYYFDPATFAFLEERDGHNGQPSTYNAGSPGYNAPAPPRNPADDVISGAANIDIMTSEKIVTTLPTMPSRCKLD
jgi:hypothetical protein